MNVDATQAPARESEIEALRALVESRGWQLFRSHVLGEHGAERCIQQIDAALGDVPRGDDAASRDTVAQIRAASRAGLQLIAWPAARIAQLKPDVGLPAGQRPPFERRGGR